MVLKTPKKKETENLWGKVYNDYLRLMGDGGMKMPVYDYLGRKYGYDPNYIPVIIKKVRKEVEK